MDILEKEISDLKVEIEGYKIQLEGATGEDRNLLLKTINTCRETLNRSLDEKKALQSAGTFIYCSSLSLNCLSRTTMLLIFMLINVSLSSFSHSDLLDKITHSCSFN
jgi:hypothetical protein